MQYLHLYLIVWWKVIEFNEFILFSRWKKKTNFFFLFLIDIPCPPNTRLSAYDVFDSRGKPRVDILKTHFIAEGRVTEDVALKIIEDGAKLLRQEKTMVDVEAPITGNKKQNKTIIKFSYIFFSMWWCSWTIFWFNEIIWSWWFTSYNSIFIPWWLCW